MNGWIPGVIFLKHQIHKLVSWKCLPTPSNTIEQWHITSNELVPGVAMTCLALAQFFHPLAFSGLLPRMKATWQILNEINRQKSFSLFITSNRTNTWSHCLLEFTQGYTAKHRPFLSRTRMMNHPNGKFYAGRRLAKSAQLTNNETSTNRMSSQHLSGKANTTGKGGERNHHDLTKNNDGGGSRKRRGHGRPWFCACESIW